MEPQLSIWVFSLAAQQPLSWQPLLNQVRAADRAGIDRVVLTGEHVVFGENLTAYSDPALGGRSGARQLTGPDGHYLEPMVTLSVLSAITTRTRLTSNIMLAALRRPIVLAKAASTLDVLSNGRLDLGVGVGWQREEYEAAGLEFKDRGRLLDHTLEVCQTLWTQQVASYTAPELSFERIHQMPKPVNPKGVPVWISGAVNPPVMRRLARFGVGWLPWGRALESPLFLFEEIGRMREAVSGLGRDFRDIQVAGTLPLIMDKKGSPAVGPTLERVPEFFAAGVTDMRVALPIPEDTHAAEDYLAEWATAFRKITGRG